MGEEEPRSPFAPAAWPAQTTAAELRKHGRGTELDGEAAAEGIAAAEVERRSDEPLRPPEDGDTLANDRWVRQPCRPEALPGGQLDRLAGKLAGMLRAAPCGEAGPASGRGREQRESCDDRQRAGCEEGGAFDAALLSTSPRSSNDRSALLEHLFNPLRIGAVELPNRIVSTAHQTTLVHDHLPTDDFVAYHEARARGGVGLIVLEATAVHPSGLLTPHTLAGYRPEIVPGLRRVGDAVQEHGTRVFMQLFHGGREQIATAPKPPAVAPSAVPTLRFHAEPRALEPPEISSLVDGYAQAAANAAAAGLDGVEISAAHNYLPAQFFTPALNRRDDEWGEPTRFLLAVVAAVREAAGELAVGVRLSADSEAALGAAEALAGHVDYLSVALGESSTYVGSTGIVPPPPIQENAIAALTAPFRGALPLVATSRIVDPLEAERLLAEERCDAVGMTRALITDPELPLKARDGRLDDVLRCIGCNACIAHYHAGTPIACTQNPRTGRERTLPAPERGPSPRRVVVVGAGPAGLAAAAEAGASGHDVHLLERAPRIGGQIALAGAAPMHAEMARTLVRNYERLLERGRVRIRAGEEASA
jgi:2,4-dienoyl-CoA reductase-like NADH-dependent reductase (Old Yellow Enzyme family)